MRLLTAVALALTVLLATSTLGVVVATPSAAAATAPDRSPSDTSLHDPALLGAQSSDSIAPVSSTAATTDQRSPLTAADPAQVIRINVTETGDTVWTIESRFLLTDDDDVETFRAYADDVVAGERDVETDRQRFESEATLAEEQTGRSMSIEEFDWNDPRVDAPDEPAEFDDETKIGTLSYSFTWTNYATVDGDRIQFGIYSSLRLSPDQRLVVQSPPDHGFDEFSTPPTTSSGGAFVWDGPREFETDELDIAFVRVAGGTSQSQTLGLIAGSLALVIVGAIYLLTRRRSDDDPLVPPAVATRLPVGRDTQAGETASSAEPDGDVDDDDRHPSPTTATEDAPDDDTALTFEGHDDVDPELLSDEERVHRLLRRNGGRMKQGSIVSETGWSNAKVSQLLSKMDDDDEIDKLRIGRENLITLPGVDPTEIE